MTVSRDNSKAVDEGVLIALPETWLVYLLQLADDDPEMTLVEVAKEEEAIGVAAGAYLAGAPNALLMQNHGFLASINGIVSLALLDRIPLVMLIALRGHSGEPYPWHTQGGMLTEPVIRALGLPFEGARDPQRVGQQIREARTLAWSSLSPVALLGLAGGFASHTTAGVTDLGAIARGAGCPRVRDAANVYQFMEAIGEASEGHTMSTIVAKVEAVGPDHYGMNLHLPENAFRFHRHIEARSAP